jgi:hypothetical protein
MAHGIGTRIRTGTGGLLALLLLLVVGLAPAAARQATPEDAASPLAGLGYPELVITTDGTDFDPPAEVEAGRYRLVLQNNGELNADIELYQLPEGITPDDLLAAFEEDDVPDWFFETVFGGGPVSAPGQTGDVVVDLTPGEWVFNLYTYTEDEEGEDADLPKIVTVTGEMPAVEDPAGAVEIEMDEFDFAVPDDLAAGPQVWQVTNVGEQPHHMIGVSVPDGTTEEQVAELAATFFGPPATPEAGATPVEPALSFEDVEDAFEVGILSTGRVNWLGFDLAPGTYAAICFLPDPETGMPHVMLGMVEVFTVA